ncbi:MAG: hypothetical protein WA213_21600 [Terriglobales bacterium]
MCNKCPAGKIDPMNHPKEWVPRIDPKTGRPELKYSSANGGGWTFDNCELVLKGSEPERAAWWDRLPQLVNER